MLYKLLIFLLFLLFISGCGPIGIVTSLKPHEIHENDFLMVANYDSYCDNGIQRDISIKKGDIVRAEDVYANTPTNSQRIYVPDNTIWLRAQYTSSALNTDAYPFFFMVYPDGTFISKDAHMTTCVMRGDIPLCQYLTGVCSSKDNQPLFKSIKKEDLK